MKLTKSTLATTFAALLIGGLAINPATAKVHETGRVDMSTRTGFELEASNLPYTNGRVAPEGTQPIMESNAGGRTNGRQG